MAHANDRQTNTEDEAFLDAARRVRHTLRRHPFALGFLAVLAAAAIFLLGIRVGEVAYLAFDGEGMRAAVFVGTLFATLVTIIGIGVWLDRR